MATNGIKVTPINSHDKWDEKLHQANLQKDALKYGRFWMWQGYIHPDLNEKLLDVYIYIIIYIYIYIYIYFRGLIC